MKKTLWLTLAEELKQNKIILREGYQVCKIILLTISYQIPNFCYMKQRKNIFRVLLTDLKVPIRSRSLSTRQLKKLTEDFSIVDLALEVPYIRKLSLGQYLIGLKNRVMMALSGKRQSIFDQPEFLDKEGRPDWKEIDHIIKCDPQTTINFPFKPSKAEFNNLKELLNDTAKQSLFEEQIKNSNPAQSRGERDIIWPGTPSDQEGSGGNAKKPKQPAEPTGAEVTKPVYGETNPVFTADAAQKARELLIKKLGNLNVGIDPEVMQPGIQLAGYHIEASTAKFVDFIKVMEADIGNAINPYLKSFYSAVRDWPGFKSECMDDYETVSKADGR